MIRDAFQVVGEAIAERAADRVIALLVGSPVRSAVLGAALLYLGARTLGWWLVVLLVGGALWELVRWPGGLPARWT